MRLRPRACSWCADDADLGEQRLAVGAVDPVDEHAGLSAAGAEFGAGSAGGVGVEAVAGSTDEAEELLLELVELGPGADLAYDVGEPGVNRALQPRPAHPDEGRSSHTRAQLGRSL